MKKSKSERNDARNDAAPALPTDEIRGRAGERVTTRTRTPGGGGSRERVAAKGNDITREDDLLQGDIEDEVDNALREDRRNEEP